MEEAVMDETRNKAPKIMHPIKDLDILFQPIETEEESAEYVEAGVQLINDTFNCINDMDALNAENIVRCFREMRIGTLETKKLNQQVFIKHRAQCPIEGNLLRHFFITMMQHHLFKQNRFDLQNGERIVKAMEHIRYLGCTLVKNNIEHYATVRASDELFFIPDAFEKMRHYSPEQRVVMKAWCYKEIVVLYNNISGKYDDFTVRMIVENVNSFVTAFPRNPYRFRVLGELLYHRARAFFAERLLDSAKHMYVLAERTFMSAEDFVSEVARAHAVERCRRKINYMKMVKVLQEKKVKKEKQQVETKRKEDRQKNRSKDSPYVYMGGGGGDGDGPLIRISFGTK